MAPPVEQELHVVAKFQLFQSANSLLFFSLCMYIRNGRLYLIIETNENAYRHIQYHISLTKDPMASRRGS